MPLVIIPEVDDSWSGNDQVGQQQKCEVKDRERAECTAVSSFWEKLISRSISEDEKPETQTYL